MTRLALQVRGLGAVSPVGLSAPATFAALRASIARLGPIETHAVEGDGVETQALIGGRVPLELLEGQPEDAGADYPGHRAVGAPQPPPLPTYVEDGPARLAAMVFAAAEEAIVDAGWSEAAPSASPPCPFENLPGERVPQSIAGGEMWKLPLPSIAA